MFWRRLPLPLPLPAADEREETLQFKNQLVNVRRKSYRRSIGLTLNVNGKIQVSAARTVPLAKIREFLLENGEWIEGHLQRYRQLRESYPPKRFCAGDTFMLLGRHRRLDFIEGEDGGNAFRFVIREGNIVGLVPRERWRSFDSQAAHPDLAAPMARFCAGLGRQLLAERLDLYSEKMQLRASAVYFRSQKTRWGSCSSSGQISLNWRLIIAPLAVVDYVVIHELAHLQHHDHSAEFWRLVTTQSPECLILRDWLREHMFEADFLARRSELHG